MKGSSSTNDGHDASDVSAADSLAIYREQLECWVQALSTGDIDVLRDAVEPGFRSEHVAWFVDGNSHKRSALLMQLLEFVAPVFDEFEDLVDEFVAEHPFAALDSRTGDADKCLGWIEQTQSLTAEQQDYVACQRARHAVELLAAERRIEHVRFHEVRSLMPQLLAEFGTNEGLRIYVNPVHAWARFHTPALVEDGVSLPSDVVFYATGGGIRTAVVNDTARLLICELAEYGPLTLHQWAATTNHADREELIAACKELAELELIALC